jgi:hypothetical protein
VKRYLAPLGLTVLLVGALAVAAWQPWASKEREQEIEWLTAFDAWSDRIDAGLEIGDLYAAANCMDSYDKDVGEPPARLAEAGKIARSGCRSVSRSNGDSSDWEYVRGAVVGELTELRRRAAAPARSAELARYAAPLAERLPKVLCWPTRHWDETREDWSLVHSDELWLLGFADPAAGTIDLAPEVCDPLHRFFGGDYAPSLNEESLYLAYALVVLAHEAEHLRSPEASEAAVECVAIQRVRDLVRAAGRGASYEDLMAGLAWDVGYPDLPPEYRTKSCHDGSELDVRTETDVWP